MFGHQVNNKDASKAGELHLEDYTPTALIKPFISLHGHSREHKVKRVGHDHTSVAARYAGDLRVTSDSPCAWSQSSSSAVFDRTLGRSLSEAEGSEDDGEMKRRLDNVSVALESARKDTDTHRSKAVQGEMSPMSGFLPLHAHDSSFVGLIFWLILPMNICSG